MEQLTFGSVCSGIEAASVAFAPLGWKAAWLSEIDPFASAVLAHHYPDVPNLGDMTQLPARIASGEVHAPDIFCGGTPCQAFSVAGLRRSLDDARGNLSLTFCEIANATDAVRLERGKPAAVIFWENVPGVLNTRDNAFGCFLAGLAGEDDPLEPPGAKWTNAGFVSGPKRAVAWRVLDAQYFGVAQRRRRVFVVASARNDFDPAKVLFEFDGVRRDIAPSRQAGKVAPTIPSRSTAGGGLGTDFDLDGGVITMAHGQGGAEIGFDRGPCLTCNHEAPIAAYPVPHTEVMPTMASGAGTEAGHNARSGHTKDAYIVPVATTQFGEMAGTLTARHDSSPCADRGMNVVAHPIPINTMIAMRHEALGERTGFGIGDAGDPSFTLTKGHSHAVAQPIPFDTTQITSAENRSRPQEGDPCHPLTAGAHAPAIAFPANLSGTQHASAEDLAPSMGATNPTAVATPYAFQPRIARNGRGDMGDVVNALNAQSGETGKGDAAPCVATPMAVRRLTPEECEALQGFPRSYTAIPWRKKPSSECPDGPRYKALGNSWAVPNVRWIGARIKNALQEAAQRKQT